MAATNNTSLTASLGTSAVELEATVNIQASPNKQWTGTPTGWFERSSGGTFTQVGPIFNINIAGTGLALNGTHTHTDSASLVSGTEYSYRFVVDSTEEQGGIEQ
tara:strand:- start:31 stop:342 length:312 start_codon:yes stop_codon:yes gene_type:complete